MVFELQLQCLLHAQVRNIELCLRFLGERGAAVDGIEPKSTFIHLMHTLRVLLTTFAGRSNSSLLVLFSR